MTTVPTHLPALAEEIDYPETDGQPMGETGYHVAALLYLFEALERHFQGQQVLVAVDLFLYYTQGDRSAVKAPDVMIVKGVDPSPRSSFKTWKENALPCFVIEVTSKNTVGEDLGPKRKLYAQLGVAEYFLFDPQGKSLDPPLQGFRLKGGRYVRLSSARDGSFGSKELGLRLRAEGVLLRLVDTKTGEPIPTRRERDEQAKQAIEQEKQRVEQEKQRVEQEKQRAEQEKQRAEQEKQRAEQEKQRAEQEKQRAEQAEHRADALAAQLARVQEELERQKQKPYSPE